MTSRKEVEEAVKRKSRDFSALFSTPEGQRVLKCLDEEFNGAELRAKDPHNTYYNLGRRDVVTYIRQMIAYSERGNNED